MSPCLLFLLETKVLECGGKIKGEWNMDGCLKRNVKFSQSVTSASSSLLLMQKFTKIYCNISWCQLLINSLEMMSSSSRRILLHHTAKSTQAWCENSHIHVLDWPANSPDLNPIENLWGIVKKKLYKHQPNTCEQLKDAIKTCCNEVTPNECQQLIHSMPCCIEAVIKARGDAIKY